MHFQVNVYCNALPFMSIFYSVVQCSVGLSSSVQFSFVQCRLMKQIEIWRGQGNVGDIGDSQGDVGDIGDSQGDVGDIGDSQGDAEGGE